MNWENVIDNDSIYARVGLQLLKVSNADARRTSNDIPIDPFWKKMNDEYNESEVGKYCRNKDF